MTFENFRNLNAIIKYNIEISNPFTLCCMCSYRERTEIINRLASGDTSYVADENCQNICIDLYDKYDGFKVSNMRFVTCSQEQKIRKKLLLNRLWFRKWLVAIDLGEINL